MVSFSVPDSILNRFDSQVNPLGSFIDEAERTCGHVIHANGKYAVVSDFELAFRKLQPVYSAGVGFNFEVKTTMCN